jgi:hypothetical protein
MIPCPLDAFFGNVCELDLGEVVSDIVVTSIPLINNFVSPLSLPPFTLPRTQPHVRTGSYTAGRAVFNFYKVYAILDEVFLAGEIEETSKSVVLDRLDFLEKLD